MQDLQNKYLNRSDRCENQGLFEVIPQEGCDFFQGLQISLGLYLAAAVLRGVGNIIRSIRELSDRSSCSTHCQYVGQPQRARQRRRRRRIFVRYEITPKGTGDFFLGLGIFLVLTWFLLFYMALQAHSFALESSSEPIAAVAIS
jgi:hypothetical protein